MGKKAFFIIIGQLFGSATHSASNVIHTIDVLHYYVSLTISMKEMSVKGTEVIEFVVNSESLQKVNFDFENLQVQAVTDHKSNCNFRQLEDEVEIDLSKIYHRGDTVTIKLQYQGKPKKGLKFFPEANQVYTEFWTSAWMACIIAPSERASLHLDLTLPKGLTATATGKLVAREHSSDSTTAYSWHEDNHVPAYIYGFAVF